MSERRSNADLGEHSKQSQSASPTITPPSVPRTCGVFSEPMGPGTASFSSKRVPEKAHLISRATPTSETSEGSDLALETNSLQPFGLVPREVPQPKIVRTARRKRPVRRVLGNSATYRPGKVPARILRSFMKPSVPDDVRTSLSMITMGSLLDIHDSTIPSYHCACLLCAMKPLESRFPSEEQVWEKHERLWSDLLGIPSIHSSEPL